MAKIIQLSLAFSGSPMGASAEPQEKPEAYSEGLVKNPCFGCQFREICDEDSCGIHLFDLDIDHDPSYDMKFEEWLMTDKY